MIEATTGQVATGFTFGTLPPLEEASDFRFRPGALMKTKLKRQCLSLSLSQNNLFQSLAPYGVGFAQSKLAKLVEKESLTVTATPKLAANWDTCTQRKTTISTDLGSSSCHQSKEKELNAQTT